MKITAETFDAYPKTRNHIFDPEPPLAFPETGRSSVD
jgi:hypothetical protein